MLWLEEMLLLLLRQKSFFYGNSVEIKAWHRKETSEMFKHPKEWNIDGVLKAAWPPGHSRAQTLVDKARVTCTFSLLLFLPGEECTLPGDHGPPCPHGCLHWRANVRIINNGQHMH